MQDRQEDRDVESDGQDVFIRLKQDNTYALVLLIFSCFMFYMSSRIVLGGDMAGWFLLAVFGLSSVTCFLTVLPGSRYLEISSEGLTITSNFRRKTFRWDQIERMGIYDLGIVRRIGIDLNQRYSGPERVPQYAKSPTGYHVSLPTVSDMDLEALLETMEQCRQVCEKKL